MLAHQVAASAWSLPPLATFGLVVSAIVYMRGWWRLRRSRAQLLPVWRAMTFLAGLIAIWVALASPLDALNELLLTAHMLQHMLLMMVAPPLILLGAPLIPMLHGLPNAVRRTCAEPFMKWSAAEWIGHTLASPVVGALAMGLVMFVWHTPRLYELALGSEAWHEVEHASFVLASLIFWWPVVLPFPSRGRWPRWAMVPYLLLADLQNTALSAILTFSDRVLYRSYSEAPRQFGLSALEDQVAAGAFMWVAGSLAFILPAIVIAMHCLSSKPVRELTPPVVAAGTQ